VFTLETPSAPSQVGNAVDTILTLLDDNLGAILEELLFTEELDFTTTARDEELVFTTTGDEELDITATFGNELKNDDELYTQTGEPTATQKSS
jgi:hypothetical protein